MQQFEIWADFDETCFCRDENCGIIELHAIHDVTIHKRKKEPPVKLDGEEVWKRSSPRALDRAIMKQTSRYFPTHFGKILRGILEDYGTCEERTVYRRIKRLVERGNLIKLDLRLPMAAYIRPKSKLLEDLGGLREQMFDILEAKCQYT